MTEPTVTGAAPDVAAVEKLLHVMIKGLRAVQLYLPNNPVYQRALENIKAAFAPVWEECGELTLEVGETDLVWDGTPVLSQPKNESLAWVLYKDGVRAVTLLPGVEDDEIVRFLHVVNRTKHLPPESNDDLLTLLWEQDFEFLRYASVDLTAGDAPPLAPTDEDGGGLAAVPPEVRREEVRRDVEEGEPEADGEGEGEVERAAGIVDIEEFDSTLYFLEPKEIEYLRSEVEREYGQNLRNNVLSMLFDLLELQTYPTVRAELISIVENFIPYLLAAGDFQVVALVLREIRVVLQRARELSDEHRATLRAIPAKLSEPDSLAQLLQSLDEAHVHPTEQELSDLFQELKPEALETLLAWLPRLTNQRVRDLLSQATRRLAGLYPERVGVAMRSSDEAVVTEAARVAGHVRLQAAVPALGEALQHSSPQVRRTAVNALATIGSPGALKQLEAAIDDADRDVRIAAVRAFVNRGYRGGLARIEAAVLGSALRDADLTEKTAFFEAYGVLAGAAGIGKLQSLLRRRGFLFRRKQGPETRACAAMALGKIGTPEARDMLAAMANDKDPLVRTAVNRALREGR